MSFYDVITICQYKMKAMTISYTKSELHQHMKSAMMRCMHERSEAQCDYETDFMADTMFDDYKDSQ